MSNIPAELKYIDSHEWIRIEGDFAVVGVTDHAQDSLGDVVFVELPEVGAELSQGEESGVVESVKAASDIYSPLSGEVVEVNGLLEDAPETVNESPYVDGWFYKLRLTDTSELDGLLDAEAYQDICEDA
ncbi:MAG: glycine cleavage system protein GcvH [Pseudomonadales bacterium]|jgi:glycine cleavage system H protein|uniref:glycine cleavage system protein GcvH n=1 Tax=uncultured Umboniibacter sp. TaxID=1798917 RepID=UPI0026248A2A|nr:glycine cleavage system protein GcvH [uncultured Umboniibacter sp.]